MSGDVGLATVIRSLPELEMGHHRVTVSGTCPACGGTATRHHVARTGSSFKSSTSVRCSSCRTAVEIDGDIPDDAREAFLRTEGRWELRIESVGPDRAEVFRLLRARRGGTTSECFALMKSGEPVVQGLLVEIEELAEPLRAAGATVVERRIG